MALMVARVDNGMFSKSPPGAEGLEGRCYYQRTAEGKQSTFIKYTFQRRTTREGWSPYENPEL